MNKRLGRITLEISFCATVRLSPWLFHLAAESAGEHLHEPDNTLRSETSVHICVASLFGSLVQCPLAVVTSRMPFAWTRRTRPSSTVCRLRLARHAEAWADDLVRSHGTVG